MTPLLFDSLKILFFCRYPPFNWSSLFSSFIFPVFLSFLYHSYLSLVCLSLSHFLLAFYFLRCIHFAGILDDDFSPSFFRLVLCIFRPKICERTLFYIPYFFLVDRRNDFLKRRKKKITIKNPKKWKKKKILSVFFICSLL